MCVRVPQALDGTSLLWDYYSKHISLAMVFYNHLLLKMEQQFGVRAAQLSAMNGEASMVVGVCNPLLPAWVLLW